MAEVALASAWPLWEPAGIRLHEHKLLQDEAPLYTLAEMIQVFFLFFWLYYEMNYQNLLKKQYQWVNILLVILKNMW